MNKDKVRGFFLGTGIGDGLGVPVEGWPYERIKEQHGRLETFISAKDHKWFRGEPPGSWSDDTQLTLAVAEAITEAKGFDLDKQAEYHVKAFNRHTNGWGTTTREAIRRLSTGISWKESGNLENIDTKKPLGLGNGVCMKAGPIGIMLARKDFNWAKMSAQLADFTGMTHRTSMAVSSCLAHVFAVFHCFKTQPENFSSKYFLTTITSASEIGKSFYKETLEDDITERFRTLGKVTKNSTTEDFIESFGKGNYYVYNSLPFTYAFFVKDPTNIEMLYECASAGGDTDSNASMLGGLMGALCGTSIFPKSLIDGLQQKDEIIKIADSFADAIGV